MVNFFLNDTAPTEIYTYLHTYPYTTLFQSPRRRPLPPAAVRLGRAIGRLGPRRGAARGDSDRRRDPRQHLRHVDSRRTARRRQPYRARLTSALARRRALSERAGTLSGDAARARRPGGPAAPQDIRRSTGGERVCTNG